ncbi:MAG: hypothetical protein BZ138_05725 [Methanosphaera sp. rholeuAM270]|nr:MAG: hypothetical protein BZ138_05725 [Methanosphaera sp. rholeuAM270]
MVEIKYVTRKDSKAKEYIDNIINPNKILEENYAYILESMEEESYIIDETPCNLFRELILEEKVVGFATYIIDMNIDSYSLNNIYVLPEYRGNLLFLNEIHSFFLREHEISIFNPNHRIIDILLENGLADYLSKNLVVSAINLDNSASNYKSNIKNKKLSDKVIYSTNVYDTKISATVLFDDLDESICYSKELPDDIIHYNAKKQRKVGKQYYLKLKEHILDNTTEIIKILKELKEDLPYPEYDLEVIVGKAPELSEYLEDAVENDLITKEKAYEIQKQITYEFNENLIFSESLMRRLSYLIMEDELDEIPETDNITCLYCKTPVDYTDKFCPICGFNNDMLFEIQKEFDEIDKVLTEFSEELKKEGFTDEEINEIIGKELDKIALENNLTFE